MRQQNHTNHQPQPKNHSPKVGKAVYEQAFLSEWLMLQHYSPEDFKCRFAWPELGLETGLHFAYSPA